MPHSVPHMVQLKKFIVTEDTVFLLLQYAEGNTCFYSFIVFIVLTPVFFGILHMYYI